MTTRPSWLPPPIAPHKPPPKLCPVQSFTASIAGHRVHMSVGEYPGPEPRRPSSLAVELHKEGAPYRSMMAACARSVTHGLQRGVPLGVYVDDWIGCSFEPNGTTDDPDVPVAKSILDWMARTLVVAYPEACPGVTLPVSVAHPAAAPPIAAE